MKLFAFWGMLFFACSDAYALDTEKSSTNILRLSLEDLLKVKVVSVSRSQETVVKAPATIRVISRKQIKERGYQNLADALQDSIGIDHAWATDSPDFNRIGVRGIFGNNKLIILQDGIRVSPATGDVIAIAENFPLHAINQIEILYGPASALYGADAMTAVINLITMKDQQALGELTLIGGENNYSRKSFLGNWTQGAFNIQLAGHQQQINYASLAEDFADRYPLNDLVNFAGDTIVNAAQRTTPDFKNSSHSFNLRIAYDSHWSIGYSQREFRYPTSTASLSDFVDYAQNPFWQAELDTAYLSYQGPFSKKITTEITLSQNRYQLDTDTGFANIFVGFERNYKYAWGQMTELSQLFKLDLNESHHLSAGYTLQWLSSIPLTADLPSQYQTGLAYNQQRQFFPGTDNQLQIPIFKVNWRNSGVFAQLQSQWTDKLTGIVGFRYDDSTTYGGTVNPRLGLVYQRSPDSSLKLSYAEAFLAPSPQNSYRFFGSFAFQRTDGIYQSFFFQLPNSALKPEKLKTVELGWTNLWNENWLLETSIYANRLNNLIQAVTTSQPISNFIVGGEITTTQINDNVATLQSQGIDITLNYQKQWNANNSLNAWLNYSYVDGDKKTIATKTQLPFTSPAKLRSGFTWNWHSWNISPSLRWTDRSTLSEVGTALGKKARSYQVMDLFIQRQALLPGLDIYLDANNLLNTKYGSPGEGSATVFSEVPQLKRWFAVGLTYQF